MPLLLFKIGSISIFVELIQYIYIIKQQNICKISVLVHALFIVKQLCVFILITNIFLIFHFFAIIIQIKTNWRNLFKSFKIETQEHFQKFTVKCNADFFKNMYNNLSNFTLEFSGKLSHKSFRVTFLLIPFFHDILKIVTL